MLGLDFLPPVFGTKGYVHNKDAKLVTYPKEFGTNLFLVDFSDLCEECPSHSCGHRRLRLHAYLRALLIPASPAQRSDLLLNRRYAHRTDQLTHFGISSSVWFLSYCRDEAHRPQGEA